jgi:hypothetical protein
MGAEEAEICNSDTIVCKFEFFWEFYTSRRLEDKGSSYMTGHRRGSMCSCSLPDGPIKGLDFLDDLVIRYG